MEAVAEKNSQMEFKEYIFIHIIESPSPDDFLSKRMEGEPLSKALELMEIKSQHILAVTKDMFIKSFIKILEPHLKSSFLIPIIHISAHGDSKGIRLTSGEFFSWIELEKLLTPLNKVLDGYLLLFMSSCEGLKAGSMVFNESSDCPFYALVGNSGKPAWSETLVGYMTIYHLLGKGFDIKKAVETANIASGNENFHILDTPTVKKIWKLNEILKDENVRKFIEQLSTIK